MPAGDPGDIWEQQAVHWLAWTRTPGGDVFPYYWPAFAAAILPESPGVVLEVGCGEGRVARLLGERAGHVVGLDASPTLVRAARDDDGRGSYVVGDGTRLPFGGASFDTVVAYNALQAMPGRDDMYCAVAEAGRVLRPGGALCIVVAHPMTDVGALPTVSAAGAVEPGAYADRRFVDETVERGALSMRFIGWTATFEDYARALEDAGFVIERLREPLPTDGQVRELPALAFWWRWPLFLMLRARKT
jgi:SAM-dependent methyltransferase